MLTVAIMREALTLAGFAVARLVDGNALGLSGKLKNGINMSLNFKQKSSRSYLPKNGAANKPPGMRYSCGRVNGSRCHDRPKGIARKGFPFLFSRAYMRPVLILRESFNREGF